MSTPADLVATLKSELREARIIYPTRRITDTGKLYPFRPGIARILERTLVPVVPMTLRGLWGSFFSGKNGSAIERCT